ncbi:MAG: sigma-70 family RNA polymerase sigma factor [Firmicutes bacterium]|jgi:RNA polymerase sporulation-specific sigma factor|nr:sigma-70 family RNA polymerase sigma factor [Bacillota bacterium]HOB22138.1 sigma-70 family RNA polymerase sigma factor [Bacillota bacterium]HQD40421.1 sigma-70 family RNA polymerase sigma factor [Bacillota bacterium]
MKTAELIARAQTGDLASRDQVIADNLKLAWHVAGRFRNTGHDLEELFQIASIGLLKAVERFDLSRGVEFSTFAVPCMIGEIRQFLRKDQPVHLGRTLQENAKKVKQAAEKLRADGTEPTVGELAELTGLSREEIVEAMEAGQQVRSLSEPTSDGTTLEQLVAAEEESGQWTEKVAITQALAELEPQQQAVIKLRFFHDLTQSEVARRLGISQVQVSRLERRALSALRARLVG